MVAVARKNLFADRVRLPIAIGGVIFSVLLILVVLSLYRGFQREAGSFVESVPGDLWVMEQDTTDIFHSSSIVSEQEVAQIATVDGVARVTALYAKRVNLTSDRGDSDTFITAFAIPTGTELLHGITVPAVGEIAIDDVFANKTGLGIGDTVVVRGRRLTVAQVGDITNVGLSQFSIISATDAGELLAVPGSVSYALVSLEPGADPETVSQAIQNQVPGVQAQTKLAFAEVNRNEIVSFFLPIITVLLGIAFLVGTVVVGLTIYTATVERTREYGVLKAIGASGGYLYRIVIGQSLIIGIAGFVLSVPLTLAVNRAARQFVPEFVSVLRWQDVAAVLIAALVMAVIAAVIPVRRIATIDPASVFRA